MGAAEPGGVSPAALAAAANLRVDEITAEVLHAFELAGVASILLKGASTTRWLYPDNPRRYQDCDLLVSPASIDAAERVLDGIGFVPELEQDRMPAWWREHGLHWSHPQRPSTVDVHRTLTGVGVDEARLWKVLSADTETMTVGGRPASVLSTPGRALVLAMNAAHQGLGKGDMRLAVRHGGEDTWIQAARLAAELDATPSFAAGLRLVPGGRALAASLNLPAAQSVEVALRATRAPAQALTVERIARASRRERIAIVRHKLVPPPTFMRHWSPRAREGRVGLLLAYAQRLAWVARRTPTAVRAWRRARRAQGEPPAEP